MRIAAERNSQAADVIVRSRNQRVDMRQREMEPAGTLDVISGPRFLLLGGGHQGNVAIGVADRSDLDIESELAQRTHFTQHEYVIHRWVLAQQVGHP